MTGKIVAVDELARAYRAAGAGAFRRASTLPTGQHEPISVHEPAIRRSAHGFRVGTTERVVLVCGAAPAVGTSTVALSLAGAVSGVARVVECCSASASGLAAASTAELGEVGEGWVRSDRDGLVIERRQDRVDGPAGLPAPAVGQRTAWTFLDCSWDVDALLRSDSWLSDQARSAAAVVLVARATVPGLRRLDSALGLVGEQRMVAVLVGTGRRWPRPLQQSASAAVRQLRARDRLVCVPFDAQLALSGLTPDPLPSAVRAAGVSVLNQVEGLL